MNLLRRGFRKLSSDTDKAGIFDGSQCLN